MPPSDIDTACVEAAAEAVRAAQAIAADPACAPRSAAAPLLLAWHALARATASPWSPREMSAPNKLLPAEVWTRLSAREREVQRCELSALLIEAHCLPGGKHTFPLTRAQILRHAARVGRMVAAMRELGGLPLTHMGGWRRPLVAIAVAVAAMLCVRPWLLDL